MTTTYVTTNLTHLYRTTTHQLIFAALQVILPLIYRIFTASHLILTQLYRICTAPQHIFQHLYRISTAILLCISLPHFYRILNASQFNLPHPNRPYRTRTVPLTYLSTLSQTYLT